MSDNLPAPSLPLPHEQRWKRSVSAESAFAWLAAGWRDFTAYPGQSLAYGALVFLVSVAIVFGLFRFGADYILLPALSGFMVVGPLLALGLYEKSRRLEVGERPTLNSMIFVRPASGGQVLFTGALLCLLMLTWLRAAVIVYALFFGVRPFPGFQNIAQILFTTEVGWMILIVGTFVGAIFAAFSFAISAFSLPMLLAEPVDAFTAMGSSMALVWNNIGAALAWGAIVLALMLVSLATGLLGLIVLFPIVGHGAWHAYRAMSAQPVSVALGQDIGRTTA